MQWIVAALILGFAVYYCSPGRHQPAAVAEPVTEREAAAKLRQADLAPYDRANYPALYAALGEAFILGELQELRVAAANAAARDRRCGSVDYAEYSDNESTAANPVIFVDCFDGKVRFYYGREGLIRAVRIPGM